MPDVCVVQSTRRKGMRHLVAAADFHVPPRQTSGQGFSRLAGQVICAAPRFTPAMVGHSVPVELDPTCRKCIRRAESHGLAVIVPGPEQAEVVTRGMRTKPDPRPVNGPRVCPCGKTFKGKASTQRTCSPECGYKYRKRKPEIPCPVDGTMFRPQSVRGGMTKVCSPACAGVMHRVPDHNLRCHNPACGREYTIRGSRTPTRTCSVPCRGQYQAHLRRQAREAPARREVATRLAGAMHRLSHSREAEAEQDGDDDQAEPRGRWYESHDLPADEIERRLREAPRLQPGEPVAPAKVMADIAARVEAAGGWAAVRAKPSKAADAHHKRITCQCGGRQWVQPGTSAPCKGCGVLLSAPKITPRRHTKTYVCVRCDHRHPHRTPCPRELPDTEIQRLLADRAAFLAQNDTVTQGRWEAKAAAEVPANADQIILLDAAVDLWRGRPAKIRKVKPPKATTAEQRAGLKVMPRG